MAPIDEDKVRDATETLVEAQHLLRIQRPFQAHEVLELQWKRCPEADRALWQALAQLAVAVTHTLRGNYSGARSLLQRARTGLIDYRGAVPDTLRVDDVVQWLDAAAAELDESPPTAREWTVANPPPLT